MSGTVLGNGALKLIRPVLNYMACILFASMNQMECHNPPDLTVVLESKFP